MKDLLIHTSNEKVDVLLPHSEYKGDIPYICFSLNQFISFFGQYVYLFEKSILENNFKVQAIQSEGVQCYVKINMEEYGRFKSQDLGQEFRIYNRPINVERYCLAILTNFNHMKGHLEIKLGDRVIRELVNFSRESK